MTVQETAPADAIAAHDARMQRLWGRYAVGAGVVVLVLAVFLGIVWSKAEIRDATLSPARTPAPDVGTSAPSAQLRTAWRTDEATAYGQPVWKGTVVTYSEHTVTGRKVLTGEAVWSYTRRDAPVCDVVQYNGRAMALFEFKGNCDQVTTLDTVTGQRAWHRTLFKDSLTSKEEDSSLLMGRPRVSINQHTLLLSSPNVTYAIDPVSGLDRWVYPNPKKCRTNGAVLGSAGTLIGQKCTDGDHLVLHEPFEGDDQKGIKWRVKTDGDIPLSADKFMAAFDPASRQLQVYDAAKGTEVSKLRLDPVPAGATDVRTVEAERHQLVWIDGRQYALDHTGAVQFWSAPAATPPTPLAGEDLVPDLARSQLAVPAAGGIALLRGGAGTVERTVRTEALPAGSTVHPVGTGFVVAGKQTLVLQ